MVPGVVPGYFALPEALDEDGVEGIARWVMRNREYQGEPCVGREST